jgi:hypothetical protein
MAYASAVVLAVVDIVRTGVVSTTMPTTPTATHGNKFLNDGKTYLEVANGSGDSINVTIDCPGSVDGFAVADLVVAVAAGVRKKIGPFTATFQQSDGYVWAVCSAVTTVTIGAFRTANP